jgi:uncharacterized OB-fold protein
MACPDCGQSISDQAEACLHCGRPIAEAERGAQVTTVTVNTRSGGKFEAVGAVLVISAVIAGMTGYGSVGEPMFAVGFVLFLAGRFS